MSAVIEMILEAWNNKRVDYACGRTLQILNRFIDKVQNMTDIGSIKEKVLPCSLAGKS